VKARPLIPPSRRTSIPTLLAVLASVAGVAACAPAAPTRPNVVLISIDSLRADHLGIYGYPKATSPAIDGFAGEASTFEHAVSVSSWTLPAHMSMLSCVPPEVHGVVDDGLAVSKRLPLLADILRQAGYDTLGVVSAPYLSSVFGFASGFREYDDQTVSFPSNRASHRGETSSRVHKRVLELLDDATAPFFLFIHYWDVHYDYTPPAPFDTLFDQDYTGDLSGARFEGNARIVADMPARDLEHLVALYDGEIAHTDSYIGALMSELKERDLWQDALVILTADHGEEFFEHGAKGHRKNLHAETVNVPLIIKSPRGADAVRETMLVGTIDIMPTVLRTAGLPVPRHCGGRPILPTDDLEPRPYFSALRGRFKTMRDGSFKLFRDARSGQEMLYETSRDPAESLDVARGYPKTMRTMRAELQRWLRAQKETERGVRRGEITYDEELARQLRALGYIQ